MNDLYDLEEEKEELQYFVSMDGPTSSTECLELILSLAEYPDYLSEALNTCLYHEILKHLEYYKTKTKIVEEEITTTRKVLSLIHI